MAYDDARTTLDAFRERERQMIARHGWLAHLVFDDPDAPMGYNCHTHGIAENLGHRDFQIVLPLPQDTSHAILRFLATEVKSGRSFNPGVRASGILDDFDVTFALATETGREVLRVILPDYCGRIAPAELDGDFARQYEGTT